jgi:hypothetical protein
MPSRARRGTWILAAALTGMVVLSAGTVWADVFPNAPGDDTIVSLGKFTIHVQKPFQAVVNNIVNNGGLQGYTWDPKTNLLTSPLLSDSATKIGKSAALTADSAADTNGVAVGSAGTMVKDSDFGKVPTGFEGAAGTREVHTQLVTLNLSDGNSNSVLAGTTATDQPKSVGEVESKSNTGLPANDFPAKSFFDVFVDINVNLGGGMGTASLYNKSALLVENNDLTSLPPKVIYTHDKSSVVDVYFRGGPNDGDDFGQLQLAGHGAGFNINDPNDVRTFNQAYAAYASPTPEPSSLALAGLGGIALVGFAFRRRRTRSAE